LNTWAQGISFNTWHRSIYTPGVFKAISIVCDIGYDVQDDSFQITDIFIPSVDQRLVALIEILQNLVQIRQCSSDFKNYLLQQLSI